ncbi:MAG: hypothetical protein U9O20_01825 [Patescibacteria group bacterium]|nr:hypothetical protein [Patescibacteria group bacterium]
MQKFEQFPSDSKYKKPKNHLEKHEFEIIDEISEKKLDVPGIVNAQNGKMTFGTDEGFDYKEKNEDAVYVNTEKNAFAVIDGIGGYGKGQQASIALVEEIQKAFVNGISIKQAQEQAHKRMEEEGLVSDGACYIAGQITDKILNGYQAGDVRLIVLGKDGKIKFQSEDEGIGDVVYNSVQGKKAGETTCFEVELEYGDRIITASDGIWDSLTTDEVAKSLYNKSAEEAMRFIHNETKKRMESGEGKPDNRGVVIYDFSHPPKEQSLSGASIPVHETAEAEAIFEQEKPYGYAFVNKIKSWFGSMPEHLKNEKQSHREFEDWLVAPNLRQQDKIAAILSSGDYDLLNKKEVQISKKERDELLKDIANGKLPADKRASFLKQINCPVLCEDDQRNPKELYRNILFFRRKHFDMHAMVSELIGRTDRSITPAELGTFLEQNPEPSSSEEKVKEIIARHSQDADDHDEAQKKWQSFIDVTMNLLYGKRYDYYQQFKDLEEKADLAKMSEDTEKIDKRVESSGIKKIEQAKSWREAEDVITAEVEEILYRLKDHPGFENLTIHGKPVGTEYSPSQIVNSIEYNEMLDKNEAIKLGMQSMLPRFNYVFTNSMLAVNIEKPVLIKVLGKNGFSGRWDNKWPLGTD